MKSYKIIFSIVIVTLCALALGIGLVERIDISQWCQNQSVSYFASPRLIILIACPLIAVLFWSLYSVIISRIAHAKPSEMLYDDSYSYLPLLLMILTFGQKSFFLGLRFFQENNSSLLVICAAGVLYLKYRYLKELVKIYPDSPLASFVDTVKSFLNSNLITGMKWKRNLFLLTLGVYLLLSSGIISQVAPLSGDEPHYLVLTHSILKDQDLEVSNNYANKHYYSFYPGDLEPAAHRGKESAEHLYANHPPGFSLYLFPFYFMGRFLGTGWLLFILRGSMAVLAALLSVYIADFIKEIFRDDGLALLTWFVVSFTSPLLFYSRHLYPEVLAALISLFVVKAILKIESIGISKLLFMGLGIGVLPWIGQKFLPLAFLLMGIALIYLWKNKIIFGRRLIIFIPVLLLIGLFYFYLYDLYGTFSPRSIMTGYLGAEVRTEWSKQYFLNWQLKPKVATLMSYFIDQKEGLLVYAPIYLFCFLGLYGFYKRHKKYFWLFTILLSFQVGLHAYLHQSSGYSPPTRPLVAPIWLIALFLAAGFIIINKSWMKTLIKGLLVISLLISLLFTIFPDTLYQNIVKNTMAPSKLYAKLSSLYFDFTKVLPSLLDLDVLSWRTIIFWLAIFISLVLFMLFFSFRQTSALKESTHSKYSNVVIYAMIVLAIISIIFCLFPHIRMDGLKTMEFYDNSKLYNIYSINSNIHGPEVGGFWVKGEREARVILQTSTEAKGLHMELQSPVNQSVKIGLADYCWSEEQAFQGAAFLKHELFRPLSYKNTWLYLINIKPESGFYPRKIIPGSSDSRYLGVFVKVKPIYAE